MGATETFATRAVAKPHRLRFWNELADRYFAGTRVDAPDPDFNGRLARWQVGELRLTRLGSDVSTVCRAAPPTSQGNLVLHLQIRGRIRHVQAGVETALGPGDHVLTSCRSPYRIDSRAHELLAVEFPGQRMTDRLGALGDRVGRLGQGAAPGAFLMRNYLLSLWSLSDLPVSDPDWEDGAARSFYDLLALALSATATTLAHPRSPTRRERILRLIEARLADDQLTVAGVAAEAGVSVRTLQQLFAGMGTTPSAYLLERRLKRSADRLVGDPTATITAVAFDHGFSDSGYFSRCFRRRFGLPPSEWRRRGGG